MRLIEECEWPSKHSIRDKGTDWTRVRALRILCEINHRKLTRNAGRNWCYILLVRVYFFYFFLSCCFCWGCFALSSFLPFPRKERILTRKLSFQNKLVEGRQTHVSFIVCLQIKLFVLLKWYNRRFTISIPLKFILFL